MIFACDWTRALFLFPFDSLRSISQRSRTVTASSIQLFLLLLIPNRLCLHVETKGWILPQS